MTLLADLATVVRSKNAGPYEITFDILFPDRETYARVRDSGALTSGRLAALYQIGDGDVSVCTFFEPALAFKFTILREDGQGSVGERDTFGAQQHAPLLGIEMPA
jgi:Domain of unknown function (DUF4387)